MKKTIDLFNGNFDQFKSHVFGRANSVIDLLRNPHPELGGNVVRSEKGLLQTFNLISKSSENYFYNLGARGGVDSVDAMFHSFSNTPGMSDVRNVNTVSAIDVTIASLTKSLIPYLAIERALDAPSSQVYFRNVVAINSAGGLNAGDIALGNFNAPNQNVNLGNNNQDSGLVVGAGAAHNFDFGAPLIPGSVVVTSVVTATPAVLNYQAYDLQKDGVFYSKPGAGTIETMPTITINYATGVVSVSNMTVGASVKVNAILDITGENDGGNTLKVTMKQANVLLESENVRLIEQESIEEMNFINKIQAQIKQAGAKIDYAQLGIKDLTSLYIEYVNRRLVKELVAAKAGAVNAYLDLSTYALATSFAETKNDKVGQFIIDLNQSLLSGSGLGATSYLVGSRGANILMNVKDRFKALPEAFTTLNGVIGAFDNIPVLRHQWVDYADNAAYGTQKCSVYATYKDPNNDSGAQVYGEFLPMYASGTALNYENPSQYSRALFAQNGNKIISSEVLKRGELKLT